MNIELTKQESEAFAIFKEVREYMYKLNRNLTKNTRLN